MPFANRKSGRGPLQRLSDQRRSLALAGLAVGAAFSAAVFRRRWRATDTRSEPAMVRPEEPAATAQPEAEAPSVQPDSGPPASVEVPPPASEPELDHAPEPINAPKADDGGTAEPAPAASAPEPATGELSTEEASILAVLAQSGRADDDRTAIAVATSLERDTADVTTVLRKLGSEGVVSGDLYTASGDKIWAVTERGVRRLGAQS
ncbi:MAG TPA: hypothetical protein VGI17_07485 [Solirubrobacterales bacterium]